MLQSRLQGARVRRFFLLLALACAGCNQGGHTERVSNRADLGAVIASEHRTDNAFLTAADVNDIARRAAEAIDATTMVIAVTDREGQVLALLRKPDAPATVIGNFGATVVANDFAVSLARTASFFSNDQAPLSSRTVRFISGVHFPPGITNKPNGALYGIENTNRGCPLTSPPATPDFDPGQAVAPSTSLNGLPCNAADARGYVFTVCDRAKQSCPIFPGQPLVAHWGMPDPAEVEGDEARKWAAFRDAFLLLSRRIDLLLALPLDKLERRAVHADITAIGRPTP